MTFTRPAKCCPLLEPHVPHTNENIYDAMVKCFKQSSKPRLASLKLDGIRGIRLNNLFSQRLKLIPNGSIRNRSLNLFTGADMELYNPDLPYYRIESIVMSREHVDSDLIQFHLLDWFNTDAPYNVRLQAIVDWKQREGVPEFKDIVFNYPTLCSNADELFKHFLLCEENNGEGMCWRTFDSPYKQGYSTWNEQHLMKFARFIRCEVTIVSCYEQMENGNRATLNPIGMTERSSSKDNKLGKDTLGGFHCVMDDGQPIDVGSGVGWTAKFRREVWKNQLPWHGQRITIKYKACGTKIVPRHAIMVGKREKGF